MSDKTLEEFEEEFKNKLEEIQLELEEVADHEFGPEIIAALGLDDKESASLSPKRGFRVHWVLPTDVSFNTCDNIEDVETAQRVFAEYACSKNGVTDLPVVPGDILILTCNHSKIEDEKDVNGEPTGASYFTDACYYVGMCISSVDLKDRNLELHEEALITAFEGVPGDAGRQFIAWDTCGSPDDCPEDPDTIQMDEIVIPEDDGSPGQEKGLVVKSEGYRSKIVEINQLKSLTFSKESGSSSADPSFAGFDTSSGSGIDEFTNTGLLVHLKNLHLNSNPYSVSGTSDTVSLFSTPTTLQQKNYKAVTIESKKVSISSDSCGELKKVSLSGSEYTKSIEVLKKDESGSSTEYTVGTIEAVETSGSSVSLGNIEIPSVSLGIRPYAGQHFLPKLTFNEANSIAADDTIDIIKNLDFQVSLGNVVDDEGCKSRKIALKLTHDVEQLTYASGVLIEKNDISPVTIHREIDVAICDEEEPPVTACGDCTLPAFPFSTAKFYTKDQPTSALCGTGGRDSITRNASCYGLTTEYTWSGDEPLTGSCGRRRTSVNKKTYSFSTTPDSNNTYAYGAGGHVNYLLYITNTTTCDPILDNGIFPSNKPYSDYLVGEIATSSGIWIFS